jgi:hypothetical protein
MLLDVVKYKNNLVSVSGFSSDYPPKVTESFCGKNSIDWSLMNSDPRMEWIKLSYNHSIKPTSIVIEFTSGANQFSNLVIEKSFSNFERRFTLPELFAYDSINERFTSSTTISQKLYLSDSVIISGIAYKIKSFVMSGNNQVGFTVYEAYSGAVTNISVTIFDTSYWHNIFSDERKFAFSLITDNKLEIKTNSNDSIPLVRFRFEECIKVGISKISIMSEETFKPDRLYDNYLFSRTKKLLPESYRNSDIEKTFQTYTDGLFDSNLLTTAESYTINDLTPKVVSVTAIQKVISIYVSATGKWRLDSDVSWITHLMPHESSGSGEVRVFFSDNSSGLSRTGKVFGYDDLGNVISTEVTQLA